MYESAAIQKGLWTQLFKGTRLELNPKMFKQTALPNEHGVWSFYLEPTLVALLLKPSWAALCYSLCALMVLLMAHPLVLLLGDIRRKRLYPRSHLAFRLCLVYGAIAALLFWLCLVLAPHYSFLGVLLFSLALASRQFYLDIKGQARSLEAELWGSSALAALTTAMLWLSNAPIAVAVAAYVLLLGRNIPTIVYVRARLKRARAQPFNAFYVLLMAFMPLILGLTSALSYSRLRPYSFFVCLAYAVLALRTVAGLVFFKAKVVPKILGFQEIAFGLITVMCIYATLRFFI